MHKITSLLISKDSATVAFFLYRMNEQDFSLNDIPEDEWMQIIMFASKENFAVLLHECNETQKKLLIYQVLKFFHLDSSNIYSIEKFLLLENDARIIDFKLYQEIINYKKYLYSKLSNNANKIRDEKEYNNFLRLASFFKGDFFDKLKQYNFIFDNDNLENYQIIKAYNWLYNDLFVLLTNNLKLFIPLDVLKSAIFNLYIVSSCQYRMKVEDEDNGFFAALSSGFYDLNEGKAYIQANINFDELKITIVHELLHSLSFMAKNFDYKYNGLDEVITDYITVFLLNCEYSKESGYYLTNIAFKEIIDTLNITNEDLFNAYFEGKFNILKNIIDERVYPFFFDELLESLNDAVNLNFQKLNTTMKNFRNNYSVLNLS